MKENKQKIEIRIDKYNLDEECSLQPLRFADIALEYEEACKERDNLKLKLEELKAKKDLLIRSKPESFGVTKVTEAVIQSVINADSEVLALEKKYLESKYEANRLGAYREAFQQRKSMIKELGELWIADYYGAPEVKKEVENKKLLNKRIKGMRNKDKVRDKLKEED